MKNKHIRILVVAVLTFALLGLAACGGGSSGGSAPAEGSSAAGGSSAEAPAAEKTYNSAEGFDPDDGMYVKAQTDLYWNGRYSNGRGFAEYLANELAGDYENIENYAVGGAFSGVLTGSVEAGDDRSNWSAWLKGWGGVEQTETFLAEHDGAAPADALYVINTGGNDSYTVADLGEEAAVEKSVGCIQQMIQNLADGGATDIVLIEQSTRPGEEETTFTAAHRAAEEAMVGEFIAANPGVNLILVNPDDLWDDMRAQGMEAYGYKTWGFYLISDWVPAYGYAYVKDDNSDKLPTSEEEDIYGYGYWYEPVESSKYYAPETADYEVDDFLTYDEYHLSSRSQKNLAAYILGKDIETDDGTFETVYGGNPSAFAASPLAAKTYSKIYTFGDSGIDIGRANEVTSALVAAR
ncbi:MAG: hypothetical protein LBR44_08060 [Clostridiales Family XIII bacterium]|jgi:hypothetical protein|nr:hypothetical protein [Clostridiales Family XIII bacterium]